MKKEISIAFLGALVPDTKDYHNGAFRRSGIMVQAGIVNGLSKLNVRIKVYSLRPVPSYPKHNSIFWGRKKIFFEKKTDLILVPFINLLILKTFTAALYEFFALIGWAFQNIGRSRVILVYNTYTPPLPILYIIGKITNTKVVAILYDLGMPPKQLKLNSLKLLIYKTVEFFAKYFIPKIDGRIVINENIAKDYAPNKHYILVDGGIGDDVLNRLFDIKVRSQRDVTKFLIAGSISPINGTRLIGETMKINNNSKIKIIFAGNGRDEDYVEYLASTDKRVEYRGILNLDELFKLYEEVDVLMNLRTTDEEDKYLFPSKIIEYLTIGKYVITTNVSHIKKEYGFLCNVLEKPDPIILSSAIDKIQNLKYSELVGNGIKSREFMIDTHTWEKQAIKIHNYIKSNLFNE